ncbi:hypothetical protein [Sorangium sp. So ce887]|uniref:hypothetical protein n=1 Tax=Sorangium sp. So ce887 TaxID=3133324 RepID=UPI003F5D82A5
MITDHVWWRATQEQNRALAAHTPVFAFEFADPEHLRPSEPPELVSVAHCGQGDLIIPDAPRRHAMVALQFWLSANG